MEHIQNFFEHLSLFSNFALVMAGILLLPLLMERMKLPGVLGYILTGIVIGPAGLGIITTEGPVVNFFSELGKLLFMFFVGIEVNLEDFNKAKKRCVSFGILTALLPLLGGFSVARLVGYDSNASLLIGSVIASHTLLGFPILEKMKLTKEDSVLVTVGGTIITDIVSMIILAICISIHQTGFSWNFLLTELVELAIFVPLIIFGVSKLARKAVIRYGQSPEGRLTVLLIVVALCAEMAQLIELEGIVGAFLAGVAVKRSIPGRFSLENLEVVAKCLFIPTFFLATGFLVDFHLLASAIYTRPFLILGMLTSLIGGKFIAAWVTSLLFHYSPGERNLIVSLSLPQMAATLASAVVAHNALNAVGEPLVDKIFVNAVVVLVIVSCVTGPILTRRYGKRLLDESAVPGQTLPEMLK